MNSLEQNKMKSRERLGSRHRPHPRACPEHEEFEQFKDEQFTNHRKSQLHCNRIRQKTINSLSVYALTTPPATETSLQSIDSPPQHPLQHVLPQEEPPSIGERLREQRVKTSKETTILRYSRKEPQQKTPFQLSQQQRDLLKSSEKINIIKKILDLYNSKSIERSYYSNLIHNLTTNKASIDAPNPPKTRNMPIKKPAKVSFRKNFKKGSACNDSSIKVGQMNMHGFDLAEEYYNHSSITLEAQGMNELIKDFLERKRINKSAEHSTISKKRSHSKNIPNKEAKESKIRKKLTKYETLNEIKAKMLQNMSDNSLNHKINKFRQFLFMINFANGVYRELDVSKYQQPFRIFVGKGNNNNLIKSIMKKRFWFQLTKNREDAHFVWTQLKEESIYERQAQLADLFVKAQPSEEELAKAICEDSEIVQTNNTARQEETADSSPNFLEKNTDVSKLRQETKVLRKNKSRKLQTNTSQAKILTDAQSIDYNKILGQFVVRKKYKFSDRIRYMKSIEIISQSPNSLLIHNHLPLNGLLGNKKAMFYMLRQYYRLTEKDIFETVPLTFHIKKGLLDEQFKNFIQKFQLQSKQGRNYWIIKPGQFSNRGQGITCTNKLEDIRTRINNLRKLGKNKSLILQKYITNPLLYNGRKFDIRAYMLLTVNNGNLRGYWYQDGYIRTSSSLWTLENIADTFIHLTNDAIQKYSSNYGKYEPGNKLTYSQLQRYLDSLKNTKPVNFQNDIYPQLKSIAIDAIKATAMFINSSKKANNFQIFGFDFMIDSNFKPWLIEINTNPCLQMSCPVLERIIPSMVQNAFRIAVDPIFVPPTNFSSTYKYNIPENALHYNKFEVIFDSERDGGELKEMYGNNRIVEQIDEYQEDKQTYEQEGEEILLES